MAAIDFKALMREERKKMIIEQSSVKADKELEKCMEVTTENILLDKAKGIQENEFVFNPSWRFQPKLPELDNIFIIGEVPTITYVPNYLTDNEAREILELIHTIPLHHSKWVKLKGRSLQCWDGLTESMPGWLEMMCDSLVQSNFFPEDEKPNHVLINRYVQGEGILPHTDGPTYIPRTVTLSLSYEEAEENELEESTKRSRVGALMRFQRRLKTSEVSDCYLCDLETQSLELQTHTPFD